MSFRVESVGSFALGLSVFLTGHNSPAQSTKETKADESQADITVPLAINPPGKPELKIEKAIQKQNKRTPEEEKEEIRKWAIENRYKLNVISVVSDPSKYRVDADDIDFIIGKKMILINKETGKLEIVEASKENEEKAANENKQIIRRDYGTWFNLGIGRNPTTTELIKNDKELKNRVQKFILETPTDSFCSGLGLNINDYPGDEELSNFCRKNPELQISYYFSKKDWWKVNDLDRQTVRSEATYKSKLARGAARNKSYVKEGLNDVPKEDKAISRRHPKSDVAAVLSGLDIWDFEEVDMQIATETLDGLDDIVVNNVVVEDQTSSYTANIVKKLNRPVKEKEIEIARGNINSDFAQITGSKYYLEARKPQDVQQDVDLALKLALNAFENGGGSASPMFTEELFSNPSLALTDKLINIAMSEPYIYTGASEAIAEREDFPLTEKALQKAKENPRTPFAKGLQTNIAIKDLNKEVDELEITIKKVQTGTIPQQTTKLIDETRKMIAGKNKVIEEAKANALPGEIINIFKEIINAAKKEIEKNIR